jgi:O-antigen/teichoic acid export membrane protein
MRLCAQPLQHVPGKAGGEEDPPNDPSRDARRDRTNRIQLAWITSLLSTVTTVAIQLLAIPLVYRSLAESGYAAYASITAAAGVIGVLNLGVGGSLVTPLAAAAAEGDEERQAVLVQAGLAPVIALCLIGMAVLIPAVILLPPKTLLGKASVGSALDLHAAILIAVTAALTSIPLSSIDVLRQAFQELHISNLLGAASNVVVCVALLVAAHHSTALMAFIAAFTLPPLAFKIGNWGWLCARKRYLLRVPNRFPWRESQRLLGDGLRYVLASFSFVLVYQWPVYWIGRTLPASESAPFAISMQVVLLSLSFTLGFLRPMWSSTADAHARGDHAWLDKQIKKGRLTIVLAGVGVLAAMLLVGQPMVRIWIRQPITLGWQTRGLIGALILLSIWEQFHFLLTLGLGQLRGAAIAIFQRAVVFALVVPLLTTLGGPRALLWGICCSILFWTAWRLPRLLHRQLVLAG